jgi:diaminopimelate decarboxylase
LAAIAAEVKTPVFVYSRSTLERHYKVFEAPFTRISHQICYSMKACSNLAVLKVFANLGGGADIVSGGELHRALTAGIPPSRIVYSGVGKRADEMDEALDADILMFNVESDEELSLLDRRARLHGKRARIALRVNPDVDPKTHPYISTGMKKNKFGIDTVRAVEMYRRAKGMSGIKPVGIDCHIGSQLTELSPFLSALDRLRELIGILRDREGIALTHLDIGGGLGISYDREAPPEPAEYGDAVVEKVHDLGLTLILEPGRVLVGNAGALITQALYLKHGPEKTFVIVDAAMNDLIRPSLYQAHHEVKKVIRSGTDDRSAETFVADLVGPICESGDFLAQGRRIEKVQSGDLLAVMSAGAYGFSMSSNYNSRPRAAEVLVDGDRFWVVRERETYDDLIRGERIPPHIQKAVAGG